MKKQSRKEREFQRREEEILEISLELFKKLGVDKVTVEKIAAEVGIAKGTIYKHFSTKEEIFATLFCEMIADLIEGVRSVDLSLPISEQIEQYFSAYISFAANNAESFLLYSQFRQILNPQSSDKGFERIKNPAIKQRMEEHEKFIYQFAEEMLGKGVRAGVLKDLPIHHLICIGDGVMEGVIRSSLIGKYAHTIKDRKKLFLNMKEVMLKGLLAK